MTSSSQQWHLAEVDWIKWSMLIRFARPCSITDDPTNSWSLVVQPNGSFVSVCFLAPTAPHHLLVPGLVFEVYNGSETILTGKIIV